ncbi:MAG: methyl-accepting chemotaxis protein [Telluria sp.]
MKLDDFKIGTRLAFSFSLLLILMTLLTSVGVWLLRDFGARADEIMSGAMNKTRIVNEWRAATELNGMRTMIMITSENQAEQDALAPQIKETSARISGLQKQLDELINEPRGQALYDEIGKKRKVYIGVRDTAFKAKRGGDTAKADEIARGDMTAAQKEYLGAIDALVEYVKATANEQAEQVKARGVAGQEVQIALWFGAIVVAVGCTVFSTRSITRPLTRATGVANDVAQGRLHDRDETNSRDETGQLLGALNRMTRDLYHIVGSVRESSAAIATASEQIAGGNEDLSARTEQQAGALEETASSMEELTSTVKQNADNARQANQLANAASEIALKGGEVVAQVVKRMDAIHASAQKITDIISVIDGIAFQTNILALNAAVEAARAGEQGRGFAVVASEVRNLAQRSASAAKEIKTLIDASTEQVDAGANLVNQAGATMQEVVTSVGRVTSIIREIALASGEQEAGIGQISQAINDMDAMTQQNAALVEEAAAASEAMRQQAAQLESAVSVFQLEQMASIHPLYGAARPQNGRLQLAA